MGRSGPPVSARAFGAPVVPKTILVPRVVWSSKITTLIAAAIGASPRNVASAVGQTPRDFEIMRRQLQPFGGRSNACGAPRAGHSIGVRRGGLLHQRRRAAS